LAELHGWAQPARSEDAPALLSIDWTTGDGEHSVTEADIIIIAVAIGVVGILIAGVIANAAHRDEDRRRFGPRQR